MSKLTPEQTLQIAELRERGWSYGRLARKFGVTDGAIHYHCLKQGALSPRSRGRLHVAGEPPITRRNGTVQRRFTPDEDARIQSLSRQGMKPAKIAERVGRAPTSVRMRLLALALHEEMAEAGL